jgi:hypothetical protein
MFKKIGKLWGRSKKDKKVDNEVKAAQPAQQELHPDNLPVSPETAAKTSETPAAGEKPEQPESHVVMVPLDDIDHRNLRRGGYEDVRGKAKTMYTIRTQFPAPSFEDPKRVFVKIAELYAFSPVHACKMIGWRLNKCVVVKTEAKPDDAKQDNTKQDNAPKEVEVEVLVGDEAKGKLSVPADMQWKHIIRAARKLPDVEKALQDQVVCDVKGTQKKDAPGKTLRFVLSDIGRKLEEAKAKAEAEKKAAEGEKPAEVVAEEKPAEVVVDEAKPEEVAQPDAPNAAPDPVKAEAPVEAPAGNRKARRAGKRAVAEEKKAQEAAAAKEAAAAVAPPAEAKVEAQAEAPVQEAPAQAPSGA